MREQSLVNYIRNTLQILKNQGKCEFIRNNTGALRRGKQLIRFGKQGSSDFLLFIKGGKTIFIECKSEKGKLTESQQEFLDIVWRLGFNYYVIRLVEEFNFVLKIYGLDIEK